MGAKIEHQLCPPSSALLLFIILSHGFGSHHPSKTRQSISPPHLLLLPLLAVCHQPWSYWSLLLSLSAILLSASHRRSASSACLPIWRSPFLLSLVPCNPFLNGAQCGTKSVALPCGYLACSLCSRLCPSPPLSYFCSMSLGLGSFHVVTSGSTSSCHPLPIPNKMTLPPPLSSCCPMSALVAASATMLTPLSYSLPQPSPHRRTSTSILAKNTAVALLLA